MSDVQSINSDLFVTFEVERKKREREEDYKIADVMTKEVSLQCSLFFNDTINVCYVADVYFFLFNFVSLRKFSQKPKKQNWKR